MYECINIAYKIVKNLYDSKSLFHILSYLQKNNIIISIISENAIPPARGSVQGSMNVERLSKVGLL